MVYALNKNAAALLSRQITDGIFKKVYFAAIVGVPEKNAGRFEDFLFKDSSKNKVFAVKRERKGVKKAILDYEVLNKCKYENAICSLCRITLITGRTHQIRCQFSSRGMPLLGDRRYGCPFNAENIGLWSYSVSFKDISTGENLYFSKTPDGISPFNLFMS